MNQLVILQKPEERDLSTSLIDRAEMIGLRIIRSSTRCEKHIEDLDSPLVFGISFRPDDHQILDGRLFITTAFQFKAFAPSDPGAIILMVACKVESEFSYRGEKPTPEQVLAFEKGNAIFSTWGFLREFIFSSVARMGFPPPVLPFLRLGSDEQESRKKKPRANRRG